MIYINFIIESNFGLERRKHRKKEKIVDRTKAVNGYKIN